MKNLCVGIDAGTRTGVAIWDCDAQRLTMVDTMTISVAMLFVMKLAKQNDVVVYLEDARLRNWFGASGREKLQGAGSVKRDCSIWETFCKEQEIELRKVAPKNNYTKLTSEQFRRLTGWQGRSSEHGRDAAMMVYGK